MTRVKLLAKLRFGLVAAPLAGLACLKADEPTAPIQTALSSSVGAGGGGSEFPSIRRVELNLSAEGSFKPGSPIEVTARLTGKRAPGEVELTLVALDEDPLDVPEATQKTRQLGYSRADLAVGGERQLSHQIAYSRAGYYRVAAIARAHPPSNASRSAGDSAIRDVSREIVWIRVTESGGGIVAAGESRTIEAGMKLLYGAAGPFVPDVKPRSEGRAGRLQAGTDVSLSTATHVNAEDEGLNEFGTFMGGPSDDEARVEAKSFTGEIWVTGNFKYNDLDLSPPNNLAPIPGTVISALCVGRSSPYIEDYDMVEPVLSHTLSNGYFTVNCPEPAGDGVWDYIDGTVFLRDSDVDVTTPGGGFVGFSGGHLSHHEIRASDDYAARAYANLHEYVQPLFSKFGRTRPSIDVEVDDAFNIHYSPVYDHIQLNYTRIFDDAGPEDGLFVAVHEYAHAFHYVAVEPPGEYSCSGDQHGFTEVENLSCAVVEGFADFATFWVIGNVTVQSPYGGDYGLENNSDGTTSTNPTTVDGVRVEAAVAAFLYDLIDGSSELDASNNGTGASEGHDDLSVPASWLLDVMKHCRLNSTISAIRGADDLMYCLEKSQNLWVVADSLSASWRQVTSVSFDQSVATYDAAKIRTLWRYNLFGSNP